MKDKRTYINHKEHGEDISHENERIYTNEDRGPLDLELRLEAEALGPCTVNRFQMYRGSRIMELEACGLKLGACSLGLEACGLYLSKLGAS
jgi:hypothetical protein